MDFRQDTDKRNQAAYAAMVKQASPNSPILLNCLKAFLVGGIICCVGQFIGQLARGPLEMDAKLAGSFTSVVMVFIGATLTGVGIYDRIGAWAGAGSAVPITGFANSMVSPAIEFNREGLILGTGAKIFTIAGPVITCGVTASLVAGIIELIRMRLGG